MGMHIGLIAAKTSVANMREAFCHTWTKFEIVTAIENLPDAKSVWAWKKAHEQFVSAADWSKDNPGKEVFVFWQDGPWAVLMDHSYTLASDEESLKSLSRDLGTVISFVVESAGGCADFWYIENGELRRRISNADTEVTTAGEPIPEEAGINVDNYYMDETEALARALGLSAFEEMPGHNCQAICVIDRTDYGQIIAKQAGNPFLPKTAGKGTASSPEPPKVKKPWWKLF